MCRRRSIWREYSERACGINLKRLSQVAAYLSARKDLSWSTRWMGY